MILKATVILPEGEIVSISLLEDDIGRLKQLQNLVGGFVEVVALPGDCYAVINENGKNGPHQVNHLATAIAHKHEAISPLDYLAGTVVLAPRHAL